MGLTALRGRSRAEMVIVAAAVVVCGLHAWSFHFDIDDAYISFRYAQNLLDGHGLVFNPGEPVEGYSNPSWVLLCALGMAAGLPPLLWARIMGLVATAAMLWLLPGLVRRLDPGAPETPENTTPAWAAPLAAATCGPIACWVFAGLETPFFTLLVVVAWRAAIDRDALVAGIAALLLCLTRPDGIVIGPVLLLWSLLPGYEGPAWKRWLGPALFVLLLGAHFLWRHSYYGWWLPNTYYAKTGDLAGQLRTGVPYGLDFLKRCLPVLLLVAVWATVVRRGTAWHGLDLRLTLGVCVLWIGYAVGVGGDTLGMFRFFVPVLPLLIAGTIVLLARLRLRAAAAAAMAVVIALALAAPSFEGPTGGRERWLVATHMTEKNLGGWKLAGDWMAENLPPGTSVALGPAGYIPWRTGFVTYDLLGLTNTHISHLDMEFKQGIAGHEKHDGAWILAQRPDYLLMSNIDITRLPRGNSLIPPFVLEVDIYESPLLPRLYEQVSFALPGGRYFNCWRRRDLPRTGHERNTSR